MTGNSTKSSNTKASNKVRIIGGDWRSRMLNFADIPDIRPTPDRVRETLFNWLQFDLYGAHCLDLFAGSGVLGLEALSRGAAKVLAVENNARAVQAIRSNAERLGTHKLELIQGSAIDLLQHGNATACDIVFLDPPFAAELHSSCCRLLAERGWLKDQALIYLEAPLPFASLGLPHDWQVLKEKRAGDVYYGLCRAGSAPSGQQ